MIWLTALFATCTGLAVWSMALGNPTAINGVIGAGLCTVALAALTVIDR